MSAKFDQVLDKKNQTDICGTQIKIGMQKEADMEAHFEQVLDKKNETDIWGAQIKQQIKQQADMLGVQSMDGNASVGVKNQVTQIMDELYIYGCLAERQHWSNVQGWM